MTTEEAIWLAAYLEGEGCFLWQKSISGSKEYRYPLIVVSSIDLDVIERAMLIMGSCKPIKLSRNKPGKQMWRTQIGGKRSLAIMAQILPYMGQRRTARINELFRLSALRTGVKKREKAYQAKLTPEAVAEIRTSEDRFKRGFQMNMARKYRVSFGTIWCVRKGLTWKPEVN